MNIARLLSDFLLFRFHPETPRKIRSSPWNRLSSRHPWTEFIFRYDNMKISKLHETWNPYEAVITVFLRWNTSWRQTSCWSSDPWWLWRGMPMQKYNVTCWKCHSSESPGCGDRFDASDASIETAMCNRVCSKLTLFIDESQGLIDEIRSFDMNPQRWSNWVIHANMLWVAPLLKVCECSQSNCRSNCWYNCLSDRSI